MSSLINAEEFNDPIVIANTTLATSTSASLRIMGGISILNTSDSVNLTSGGSFLTLGGIAVNKSTLLGGITTILDTTVSTNTSTGSLIVGGGLGIQGTLFGNLSNFSDISVSSSGSIPNLLVTNSSVTSSSIQNLNVSNISSGNIYINSTTATIFGNNSGAASALAFSTWNGTSFTEKARFDASGNFLINTTQPATANTLYFNCLSAGGSDGGIFDTQNLINPIIGFAIQGSRKYTFGIDNSDAYTFKFNRGFFSGGLTTLALDQNGNVGVGTGSPSVPLHVIGNTILSNNVSIGNSLLITGTSPSISVNTGALIVSGGVGITGDTFIGGNTVMNGNLTVSGTTITVNSTNVSIQDNIIQLNVNPGASVDTGLQMSRFQIDNNAGTGDIVNDTIAFSGTISAGSTTTSISFNSGASIVNDFYIGYWIKITSGPSNNNVRQITSYVGATRTATLSTALSSSPVLGNTVNVYGNVFSMNIFCAPINSFVLGYTNSTTGQNVNFVNLANLLLNNLNSTLITTTNLIATNTTLSNFNLPSNITFSNLVVTNSSTANAIITNLSTSNLIAINEIVTNETVSNLFSTNIITTNSTTTNALVSNLRNTNTTTTNSIVTNETVSNLVSTNLTASNLVSTNALITNLTAANFSIINLSTTNLTNTNLISTNTTIVNLRNTNITTTTLLATNTSTTNLTVGSLNLTNFLATNITTTTLLATNTSTTNLTVGSLNLTNFLATNITTTSLLATNVSTTNLTNTNLINTNISTSNLIATNETVSNLFSLNSITTNSTTTNAFVTNLTNTNTTIVNLRNTNITTTTLLATNTSTTNLTVASLLSTNMSTTNLTVGNLLSTNLSSTNTTTTNFLSVNTLNTNLTNTNLLSTNTTIINLVNTNLTSVNLRTTNLTVGSFVASSLSFGNVNVTNITTVTLLLTGLTSASNILNIDCQNSTVFPGKIVFTKTAGNGDFAIGGDGGDVQWLGGGSRALQMGSFHEMVLTSGRNSTDDIPQKNGTNAVYNVIVQNLNNSIALTVEGSASQTSDLTQWTGPTSGSNLYGEVFSKVDARGNFTILSTADAISSITGGCLTVSGGISVAKSIDIGSTVNATNNSSGAMIVSGGAGFNGDVYANDFYTYQGTATATRLTPFVIDYNYVSNAAITSTASTAVLKTSLTTGTLSGGTYQITVNYSFGVGTVNNNNSTAKLILNGTTVSTGTLLHQNIWRPSNNTLLVPFSYTLIQTLGNTINTFALYYGNQNGSNTFIRDTSILLYRIK